MCRILCNILSIIISWCMGPSAHVDTFNTDLEMFYRPVNGRVEPNLIRNVFAQVLCKGFHLYNIT